MSLPALMHTDASIRQQSCPETLQICCEAKLGAWRRRARRGVPPRAHRSLRRSEELQCDAVGIPEAQARPVRGVNDSAVLDPEALQPLDPGLQLGATRAPEADVVQPGLKLGKA